MSGRQNIVKHIVVFSEQYPTTSDPVYAFVGQLVNAFAKLNVSVSVIAPQSLTKWLLRGVPLHERYREVEISNNKISIYQPYYISLGNFFKSINRFLFSFAAEYAFKKIKNKPDVCYGHFWRCAYGAYDIAKKNNLPLFVASGESKINKMYGGKKWVEFIDYCKGVVFVSSKNKRESELLGFLINQKNIVLPNAIDPTLFYKKDRNSLRTQYGIEKDSFIVAFVGAFINRKGPQRVAEALKKINNKKIKAFFIGCEKDGVSCPFDYDGMLYKGVVPHNELVDYLNMADIFVLPTLAEGCCNAIVEAMACGLPIVSSNCDFNDDILDDSCSIRINPNSVDEIVDAVETLFRNQDCREKMAAAALRRAAALTIENRACNILQFIESCVG